MGIKATLAGVPLTLGSGQVWSLMYGVQPHQRTFVMSRARAKAVLAKGNDAIELAIEPDGFKPLRVKGLWALQAAPVDENNMGVVVADVRWKLARKSITRDYNVRRRTGDKRRVGVQLQPIQVKDIIGDVVYRRATLKDGKTRWTAVEVLEDLLGELVGANGFKIHDAQFQSEIEGLVLDRDPGDAALSRVLSFIPGARVFVDVDGVLNVVNSLDGSEADAVKAAGARYRMRPGEIEFIDRSLIRPSSVTVQFEVEPELRFDYDEDNWSPATTRGKENRNLHNVIPVVDAEITYKDSSGDTVTVTEGTWLPIQEWILAVNSRAAELQSFEAGALPGGMPALSMKILRSQILSGFKHLRNKYTLAHVGAPDTLWDRRLSALAAHFRRTFQVSSRFMDLLRSIKATRTSIVDQENGTRGKAEIFTDYFVKPSTRTLVKNHASNPLNISLGHNVKGYASDLANAASAPAEVSIIDESAGVFAARWRTDPWGDAERIVPGTLDPLSVQSIAMSIPSLLDSDKITLESGWNMAVVLTASVAVPNNSSRLYTVTVGTEEAYAKLNGPAAPSKSLGPAWTVGISAGVETARFMWLDSKSASIDNAIFQLQMPPPIDPDNTITLSSSWESLRDELLTNKNTTDALALAMAARVHSLLVDRWEGSQIVNFNPDIKPTGSMAQVSFAILGDGASVTQMNLPPILKAIDMYSLLPDGARKILQRLVQE